MAIAQFTVRKSEPVDEEAILRLLEISLGEGPSGSRQSNFWRWKHVNNFFGPSYTRVACNDSGQIIGMRAFMQWELISGGSSVRAVRAVDTATHPDYRRAGVFSTLTQMVMDDATTNGIDLIFNTPNNKVLPGYLKLGWQQISNVQPMVKVLNYPKFAEGMIRRRFGKSSSRRHDAAAFFKGEATPAAALGERREEMEKLIQCNDTANQFHGIRTNRSWDYVSWRYLEHPTIPYWTVHLEEAGRLKGCIIFRTNTRFGLKEVVLSEMLISEPDQNICASLIDQLRSVTKAHYLITHFPADSFVGRALGESGFRPVPIQGMNFAVRPLANKLADDPLHFNNWALTMGDLELF